MKKETTFLKLFTLLVLSCLSIGYAWAEDEIVHTQVINFDRPNSTLAGAKNLSKWTQGRGNVPEGANWSISGDDLDCYILIGAVGYFGYETANYGFTINFTNFKHKVTNVTISADGSLFSAGNAEGTLTSTSYTGSNTDILDVLPGVTGSYVSLTNGTINLAGLKSIQYKHISNKILIDPENFLLITYINPKISGSNTSTRYLGIGSTYTLQEGTSEGSDIYWENQGAFTKSDIVFASDNESVATISNDGIITVNGIGVATITATIKNNGEDIYAYNNTTKKFVVDDYATFSFKVVNIKDANGNIVPTGTWTSEDLQAALNKQVDASTTSVDLTGVTITDADGDGIADVVSVPTSDNPNVLIKANEGQVTNATNVLIPSTDENGNTTYNCNKLKLADGTRFSTAVEFTANATEYARSSATTWGTICLPYAPTTENATYYELTSANSNGSLSFTKVEKPEANKPYLFKNNTENTVYSASHNSNVVVEKTPDSFTPINKGDYYMHGVFNPTSVIDGTNSVYTSAKEGYDLIIDPNAYSYTNNKFKIVNGRFNMAGFRAYLTTTSSAGAKASINIDFSDDNEYTTDIKFIENKEDGTVNVIFDANGRKLNAPQKGINIINGQKVLVK